MDRGSNGHEMEFMKGSIWRSIRIRVLHFMADNLWRFQAALYMNRSISEQVKSL